MRLSCPDVAIESRHFKYTVRYVCVDALLHHVMCASNNFLNFVIRWKFRTHGFISLKDFLISKKNYILVYCISYSIKYFISYSTRYSVRKFLSSLEGILQGIL